MVLRFLLAYCSVLTVCACAPLEGNFPENVQSGQALQSIVACEGFRTVSGRTEQEVLWAVNKWAKDRSLTPSRIQLCAASKDATSQVITLLIKGGPRGSTFVVGSVTFRLSDMSVLREELTQSKNGLF